MDSIKLTRRAVLVLSQEPFGSKDLGALARLMELASATGLVRRSLAQLAEDLGVLPRTIARSIVRLERAGILERVCKPGQDMGVRFCESTYVC